MFRSIVDYFEISILDYMSSAVAVVCFSHAKVAHADCIRLRARQVFYIINSILRKVAYLHTRSAVNLVAVD